MNMNNLSQEDQAKIDKQFDSIGKKLKDLEHFVAENPGIDSEEIIGIVEKINSSTSSRKLKHEVSVATPAEDIALPSLRSGLAEAQEKLIQMYTWNENEEVKFTPEEVKRLELYAKQYDKDGSSESMLSYFKPDDIEKLIDKIEKAYISIARRVSRAKRPQPPLPPVKNKKNTILQK